MKRVGVISLGCAKNLVDTEVMLGHLARAGCELVQDPEQADAIVVNTCGFIESAREESIRTILELGALKAQGRLRRLVVAGCLVQRHAAELRAELPEVDAFIGLDELPGVVAAIGAAAATPLASELPLLSPTAWSRSRYLYDDATPRLRATPAWSAYVKIAEGCDHTCAFCAIPSFRGSFRSRQADSVLREARALAASGVREINLIAQDTSHFGRDREASAGLPELLEQLDGVVELRWIRLHYLYPNSVGPRLIETMARLPRVLDYVDMPLQHAHRDTLARMRRGGSADSHLRLLARFRRAMPEAALRTTFIVGFPGETEAEFSALLEFVRAAEFEHVGVFGYSHEQGTAAGALVDDVPAAVKRERRERLLALQQELVFRRNAARVGRRVEVLVEGAHPETEHLLVGRMRSQAPDVDGQVLINDGEAPPGAFVEVELTEAAGYDMVGRIVAAA
ncbi:MAG TPA: 30S ribosomal protein S12 methylthiotransferase RimO [Candidatus Polarisedimenticolaceae bacterium]|nr:30S ribosomal protein S12 methylthiotransferase RimO [Candidatus Polarisedimenticolaceae bacterium]